MEQKSNLLDRFDNPSYCLELQDERILSLEISLFKYKLLFDNISKEYPEIILKYHHLIEEIETFLITEKVNEL